MAAEARRTEKMGITEAEMAAPRQLHLLVPERAAQHALLSTLAVLLGRGLRTWGDGSEPWVHAFLARLARSLTRARHGDLMTPVREDELSAQLDALANLVHLTRAQDVPEPSSLACDVTPDAGVRADVLTALVAFCAFAHARAAPTGESPPPAPPSVLDGFTGGYDARARQLLKGLCLVFALAPAKLLDAEEQFAARVAALGDVNGLNAGTPRPQSRNWMRAASIASAATVGGVLIAATAGLAAPAVGAGLAAISGVSVGGAGTAAILGPVSAFLGTAAGAATFTSLFGATGAGLAGYRLDRRIRDLSDFAFCRLDTPRPPPVAAAPSQQAVGKGAQWLGWAQRPSRVPQPQDQAPQPQPLQPSSSAAGAEQRCAEQPAAEEAVPPARLSVLVAISGWRRAEDDSAEAQWRGDEPSAPQPPPEPEQCAAAAQTAPLLANAATHAPSAAASAARAPAAAASAPLCAALTPRPYSLAQPRAEAWALVWERAELLRLGLAVEQAVRSEAGQMAASEVLKHTTLAALMAALAVPSMLLKLGSLVDNPWAVAQARADKAGALLADLLLARMHGARPVCLVGISLGARVALACAQALDKAGERALGLVEDIVVLGAPIETRSHAWAAARRVAAGSVVSCFSSHDWVLALVYRANAPSAIAGVGGLHPIPCAGVRSVDVSDLIPYHTSYSQPDGLAAVLARVAVASAGVPSGTAAQAGAASTASDAAAPAAVERDSSLRFSSVCILRPEPAARADECTDAAAVHA